MHCRYMLMNKFCETKFVNGNSVLFTNRNLSENYINNEYVYMCTVNV